MESYIERERAEGKQSSQMNDSGVADATLADTRIGSGSDHTVFLNFVGMPVIGLQFDGDYGVYHSMYDDFYWMNHFGDPGYRYHTLMSQLWGVIALRLANADLLPFDFASYASNVRQFVNELTKGKDMSQLGSQPPCAMQIDDFEAAGKRLNESAKPQLASGSLDPKLAADAESRHDASRAQLAQSRRHSGASLVQAHSLRRALHLCSSGIARADRSSGEAGLGHCEAAGGNPAARDSKRTPEAAKGINWSRKSHRKVTARTGGLLRY